MIELVKRSQANEWEWKGLTLGQLLSIRNALREKPKLGSVGIDVLKLLDRAKLDDLDAFQAKCIVK